MPNSSKKHADGKIGFITNELPIEAIKMSIFIESVIDAVTRRTISHSIPNAVRCFKEDCRGEISSEFSPDRKDIYWKCSKCRNTGTIVGWQGRKM
jgi:hypothetical protein